MAAEPAAAETKDEENKELVRGRFNEISDFKKPIHC
jgi:hypothetical protein